jgi:hypothetical protein
MDRRRFFRHVASYSSGAVVIGAGGEPAVAQGEATLPLVLTASSLGATGNGRGDDGARLTAAIEERFGTLANRQSFTPVTIDFGDGRNVYKI